ncbi:NHL repeat-containing protein [Nocardioides sp.]|uniref:NHL repeat-containing protein n=1 Tax=Nocardioides sp. TaxID=35761 RepID=UPI00378444FC
MTTAHTSAPARRRLRHGAVVGLVGLGLAAGLVALPVGAESQTPAQAPPRAPGAATLLARSGVLAGTVEVGGRPVRNAEVRLLRAGDRPERARQLRVAETDRRGRFLLRVPRHADGPFYLTAAHGRLDGHRVPRTVVLATALDGRRSGQVVVNEATTVAAGFSLAQFAERGSIGGAQPGLSNAMRMTRNLVTVRTGRVSPFLRESPNGTSTQTWPTFNSLASIIGGCATGRSDCPEFLRAATDAWGHRPRTTWEAMALLPQNPSGDPAGVFEQVPAKPSYRPVLHEAPTDWVLALQFVGNGHEFNGPGNVAFDKHGAVWIINNAQWAVKLKNVCPGLGLFKLDPFAPGQPVEQYTGGGINGAGFGVGFDPSHHVWVGNFGFSGKRCPTPPTSNSVSEFRLDGHPLSPPRGYRQGPLSWPQGLVSDRSGNIWIASCGNSSLVEYPDGKPDHATVTATGIGRAFDVAVNTEGNVFVTANQGEQVFGFAPDGTALPGSPYGDSSTFSLPLGIASDRLGNTWVSNSGAIPSPCKSGQSLPAVSGTHHGSIVQVGPDGALTRFTGAGLTIPWGIAVDGDDNIWVANFTGQRVSHLCGARPATCPTGTPGDPISPSGGYAFDGLQRNTGVQVDPSGNVWLTNNWKKIPLQVNPFGRGLVAYLGMAAPVRAPLIGPPQLP